MDKPIEKFQMANMIDKPKLKDRLRQGGFNSSEADQICDIAIKATDDALDTIARAMELLPIGQVRIQAGMIAYEFTNVGTNMLKDELVRMAEMLNSMQDLMMKDKTSH